MTGDPSSAPDPEDHSRRLAAQAAGRLRARPRETWLVPLLAVPLSRITSASARRVLSPPGTILWLSVPSATFIAPPITQPMHFPLPVCLEV